MQLTKRGMYRDCGETEVIKSGDGVTVNPTENGLRVSVRSPRGSQPSYHYKLLLEPEDVLKMFLKLPTDTIAEALAGLRDDFDLAEIVPEVQKQLTIGAIQAAADAASGGTADDEDE